MTLSTTLPLPSLLWTAGPIGIRLRDPYSSWSEEMLGYIPPLVWSEPITQYEIVFRNSDDATLFHIAFPG